MSAPTPNSTFSTAGDADAVELKSNAFLVLRNKHGKLLLLETVGASYWWNQERATIRWKSIDGSVIDGGIHRCFIKYQSRRTGWGQYSMRRQDGTSTIALASFTLTWSYSTKMSIWLYLQPATQYALKTYDPSVPTDAAEVCGLVV